MRTESFAKTVIWSREGTAGRQAAVVLNASLDPLETLALRVRSTQTAFTHIAEDGRPHSLAAQALAAQPGQVRLVLSDVAPWSLHLLVEGPA